MIDARHRFLLDAPLVSGTPKVDLPIPGSLRREDAAKLYELAYFASGDVIEFGTNRGLSASILSEALTAAGNPGTVVTIDLDEELSRRAGRLLAEHGHGNLRLETGDGAAVLGRLIGEGARFGFAFVDHSHRYEHVRDVSARLHEVLPLGAYAAFHDFVDRRNGDPAEDDFDVVRGALDGLGDRFVLESTCGCLGVFRRVA